MEATQSPVETSIKRARSPSNHLRAPAAKSAKMQPNHPQINYLSRQHSGVIPVLSSDQTLPALNKLMAEYEGVLQRQESLAGNLGARPLGPILIHRFERLFDGPPRILKSHARNPNITWLDVVEFAKSKPEQFNLEQTRNGRRVCQFYTKQCRIEISEEDFMLVSSGMPQKLVPPQPIQEDEEKELSVLDTLDQSIDQIFQLASSVSTRARQLGQRFRGRRAAIMSRQGGEGGTKGRTRLTSPSALLEATNRVSGKANGLDAEEAAMSPLSTSFTAVNARPARPAATHGETPPPPSGTSPSLPWLPAANTDNVTVLNGASIKGISQEQRVELIKSFLVNDDGRSQEVDAEPRPSLDGDRQGPLRTPRRSPAALARAPPSAASHSSAVPIPSTPASLLPHSKPHQIERDHDGPYKTEMVSRMESLLRGDRILPPCDRCRRLQMDCLKNLTACMGCTRKHAKCSWKDVRQDELTVVRANQAAEPDSTGTSLQQTTHHTRAEPADPAIATVASIRSPAVETTSRIEVGHVMASTGRELDLLPPPSSLITNSGYAAVGATPTPSMGSERGASALPAPSTSPPTQVPAQEQPQQQQQQQQQQHQELALPNPAPPPTALVASSAPASDFSASATASVPTTSIGQQLQDAADGLAAAHRSVFTPPSQPARPGPPQGASSDPSHPPTASAAREDHDGDRLQALAAQVYRSAAPPPEPDDHARSDLDKT